MRLPFLYPGSCLLYVSSLIKFDSISVALCSYFWNQFPLYTKLPKVDSYILSLFDESSVNFALLSSQLFGSQFSFLKCT